MNTLGRAVALAAALSSPLFAQAPLPGDPLTPEEARTIVRVATEYARAKGFGADLVLVAVDLAGDKPEGTHAVEITPEVAGRRGEVLFFGYEKNEGVRVVVDLARNDAVNIARIPAQAVPIGREEVERAAKLALADAEVARILGGNAARFQVADSDPSGRPSRGCAWSRGRRAASSSGAPSSSSAAGRVTSPGIASSSTSRPGPCGS